jgi:hypothetical protein
MPCRALSICCTPDAGGAFVYPLYLTDSTQRDHRSERLSYGGRLAEEPALKKAGQIKPATFLEL